MTVALDLMACDASSGTASAATTATEKTNGRSPMTSKPAQRFPRSGDSVHAQAARQHKSGDLSRGASRRLSRTVMAQVHP